MLKKLEKTGLLVRSRSKADERLVEIRLTDAGRALRSKIGEGPEIGLTDEQIGVLENILTMVE